MRVLIFSVVTLFLFLVGSGCASHPKRGGPERQLFETEIKPDGSKRFHLTLVSKSNNRSERSGRARGNERGRGGGNRGNGKASGGSVEPSRSGSQQTPQSEIAKPEKSEADIREQAIAILESRLANIQYCRNGYILLEYSQLESEILVRGECQESASEQDKARWE
ncbi:MAG: hypothetical protein Alis3KO_32540 [Aliiglaciecola sp.]